MQPVRTKLHRLLDLIETNSEDADQVYFTAPPGGKSRSILSFGVEPAMLASGVEPFKKHPKFVFDEELASSLHTEAANKSMLDMKNCGLLHLPFPSIVVEVGDEEYHSICVLVDVSKVGLDDEQLRESFADCDFVAYPMSLHRDGDGEYAVVSPALIGVLVRAKEDAPDDPMLGVCSRSLGSGGNDKEIAEYAKDVFKKDLAIAWRAIFCATLLLSTRGLTREVIDCEKLNKHRVASGKPPIPHHTYIHLTRVYRSAKGEASDAYIKGKSPPPHWRRGHIHRWRTGSFKTPLEDRGWNEKWIDGRFVALARDAIVEPIPPEYHVKR